MIVIFFELWGMSSPVHAWRRSTQPVPIETATQTSTSPSATGDGNNKPGDGNNKPTLKVTRSVTDEVEETNQKEQFRVPNEMRDVFCCQNFF